MNTRPPCYHDDGPNKPADFEALLQINPESLLVPPPKNLDDVDLVTDALEKFLQSSGCPEGFLQLPMYRQLGPFREFLRGHSGLSVRPAILDMAVIRLQQEKENKSG